MNGIYALISKILYGSGLRIKECVRLRVKDIEFQVPKNELACVAKRDQVQHPFLEPLIEWGKSLRIYRFGTTLGKNNLAIFDVEGAPNDINLKEADFVVAIFKKGVKPCRLNQRFGLYLITPKKE